jgi:prepilin-type N-terminal cleavage/methylation domain-containing protein/prepilin-type processing-associated H-X9-DG protein
MRGRCANPVGSCSPSAGFTLIELLVVIAIIAILLAIMVPVMHRARVLAYRARCGSQLWQIAAAWSAYLDNNTQRFYRRVDANHNFGGWKGIGGGAACRPLNTYVGLPAEPNARGDTELFHCPADKGDADYGPAAYLYFGNSYQTNLMLIGPDSLPTGVPEPIRGLNRRINAHLKGLRANAVCEPARLLLVGDNNWITEWDPLIPTAGRPWHGPAGRYNLAFLDGHIKFIDIGKGVYLDSNYRIQPFKALDRFTREVQSRIVGEVHDSK